MADRQDFNHPYNTVLLLRSILNFGTQAQLSALKRRAAYREQKLAAAATAAAATAAAAGSAEQGRHADFMGAAEAAAAVAAGLGHRSAAWASRPAPGDEGYCQNTGVPGAEGVEHKSHVANGSGDSGGQKRGIFERQGDVAGRGGEEDLRASGSNGRGRAPPADKPRFRSSPNQLKHQLAGLHRKAALREHIAEN